MNEHPRKFQATPATRGEEPMLVGIVGPPGGGKTYSALRLAQGIQQVRSGDVVVIDTEAGRARKYCSEFQFLHVPFDPPHRPDHFLEAIKQMNARKPSCIIVDSMSDEHEGIGGYLDFRDSETQRMKGNSWAGTAQPAAARKRLINGLLQIKTPLIFTFRAREKTKQEQNDQGKTVIVNMGWMPVAPLPIVHSLDLVCLLPPRADGVAVWESAKVGEDFVIKLPSFLAPFIQQGRALDEQTGAALARWASGESSSQSKGDSAGNGAGVPEASAHNSDSSVCGTEPTNDAAAGTASAPGSQAPQASPGASIPTWDKYVEHWQQTVIPLATSTRQLGIDWQSEAELRRQIKPKPTPQQVTDLRDEVQSKMKRLSA